jgi:hypothetical protein
MATSTAAIIVKMKKMMSTFSVNMSNRFDEINANLMKLDIFLADIEHQRFPKAHEATTKELEEETKRVRRIPAVCSSRGSKRPYHHHAS